MLTGERWSLTTLTPIYNNMDPTKPFSTVSIRAMVAYEKLTGANAFEMFARPTKSATDLRDVVWMVMNTRDPKATIETVEALSGEDFQKELDAFNAPPSGSNDEVKK